MGWTSDKKCFGDRQRKEAVLGSTQPLNQGVPGLLGGMTLTTHLHLKPRLRMSGAISYFLL